MLTEVICGGVILLQLAKTADKISDAQQLSSDLNDVKELAEVEKAEDEPGADAIRGALSIRRYSTVRRPSRSTNVDPSLTGSPIPLKNRRRGSRKDGHFFDLPSDFGRRESTIREVPAEEEPRSSVQFNPAAPVTHIYPPRTAQSPEKYNLEDRVEEVDHSGQQTHNPLSPVPTPDFLSAPPTPRYPIPKRANVQKTFSFGRAAKSPGRTVLTEEETMGLVKAGQNEGTMCDKDSESPHQTEHSEESDFEADEPRGRSKGGPYEMF
jgi:hypothetical protein